ncbi:MAG: ribonuclease Z [Bacteroidota bacterium]
MKTNSTDKYTVLIDERDNASDFARYLESIVPRKFEDRNLIVDLEKYHALELSQLLEFLKLSNYHRSTKHSFVIVNNAVDIDDIPLEMTVVPSLQEAFDIVEMEEIERDLGF